MKKFAALLSFCALLVFFSCREDEVVSPNDVRLVNIVYASSGITFGYEYDTEGRITRVTHTVNNQPATTAQTISYSGNEITITHTPVVNAGLRYNETIRYTTTADKRPIQRIRTVTSEYFAPANNPQRDFENDTTTFEYNGSGQLTRSIRIQQDSTWFNPGIVQHILHNKRTVNDYTYNNGNLLTVTSIANRTTRNFNGTTTVVTQHILEDNFAYSYSSSFPNKTDFSNALVLNELEMVMYKPYFLNPAATFIPNKVTRQEALKDGSGAIISSSNSAVDYLAAYNSYGFLNNLSRPAYPGSAISYNYNR